MTHLRDNGNVRFYLSARALEDVSYNIIFLNVFEAIKQFHLSMWCKKPD